MKPSDSDILYSDNHLLVANKPCGMLTQPDDTGAESLEVWAKAWVKREFNKPGNVFLHAVHRLDKPVSGLVLFARTSKALSRLNELVRDQAIQRIYVAEVEGIAPERGQLDHYLIHGDHRAIVSKEGAKDAKHARLKYGVVRFHGSSSVVEIELETGRYHQIRAQFSAIGHPIVGDGKYGAKTNGDIHLHCAKLVFEHPVTKERVDVGAPPPFT